MSAHPRRAASAWRRIILSHGWLLAVSVGCARPQIVMQGSLLPPFIPIPQPRPAAFWTESFDAPSLSHWREISVSGQTQYRVVTLDGRQCLQAQSYGGASILLHEARFDPDTYEWLSWAWRVDRLVGGEALERKDGSDAAARVYVYFKTKGLPWQKRNLDYVWSAALPVGTVLESAYASSSKILVVESGPASLGQWRIVERNIEADYKRVFGGDPPQVMAIGLMTDTDNTRGEALTYFDDLRISRRPMRAAASAPPHR